jgi:hypothetical protein
VRALLGLLGLLGLPAFSEGRFEDKPHPEYPVQVRDSVWPPVTDERREHFFAPALGGKQEKRARADTPQVSVDRNLRRHESGATTLPAGRGLCP